MSLAERVILVTGSLEGLGAASIDPLRQGGARVAAVYEPRVPGAWSAGWREQDGVLATESDVADETAMRHIVVELERRYGPIDALMHFAAGHQDAEPIEVTTDQTWDHLYRMALWGPVQLLRAVLPVFRRRERGRIIMVAGAGACHATPWCAAGSALNAALLRLMESVAGELAGSGITINCLTPTVLSAETPAPGSRCREPDGSGAEDLARVVIRLLSPEGAGVTGTTIPIASPAG